MVWLRNGDRVRYSPSMRCVVIPALTLLFVACGNDSSSNDAGADGSADVALDKHPQDTGTEAMACPSGLACETCDNGFVATPMTQPQAHAAVCPAADITAFIAACGSGGSQQACASWQTKEGKSAPTCYDCIYSNQTDPKWGVWVCDPGGNCVLNSGGCVDVAAGQLPLEKQAGGAGSCGDAMSTDSACDAYTCTSCQGAQLTKCNTSAGMNECKAYHDVWVNKTGACAVLLDASASVNDCFAITNAEYTNMATAMCGS
jgi:hypothetical protein